MIEPSKGISVGSTSNEVHIRVVGRGTFQNGQPLRRYALDMIKRGYAGFVVDLGECLGMDSTFLGVLAGIGLRLSQRGQHGKIYVVNANQRNLELLETLGLNRLFGIETGPSVVTRHQSPLEFQRLPDSDTIPVGHPVNKDETADLMLEAHENLIRADKRNEPKFKDLTRFLRERAEQHKSSGEKT
jgi:anti-anti-sigma regulatory factor